MLEVILLALASTIRPTSLAAVTALLAGESRRRLMFAYVASGLAFTCAFGIVVVGVFHGIHIQAGSTRTKGVADIVGGIVALVFGFLVLTGVASRRSGEAVDDTPAAPRLGWLARRDRQISVRSAALAGPLTHLPGVFYLIALNVIVALDPWLPGGVIAVGIYNGIWFAVPIAALMMCIVNPDVARTIVVAVGEWTRGHSRPIILTTSFVVGVALVVRGLLAV